MTTTAPSVTAAQRSAMTSEPVVTTFARAAIAFWPRSSRARR